MDSVDTSMIITSNISNINSTPNVSSLSMRKRPPPLVLSDVNTWTFDNHEKLENDIINNIDTAMDTHMFSHARMESIATKSAIKMHNQWRRVYIQQNGDVPRIKKTKDGIEVDINVEGDKLQSEFLEFNYTMALFVANCILFYGYMTIEKASAIIHSKWLKMSPWAKDGPLDIPYESLPEIEKEKDRDIFYIVSSFF
jgi:hypothetical protein